MAHLPQAWSTYFLLGFAILVETLPTCKYIDTQETDLVCNNDNGLDYVLKRGLVSDNNKTKSVSLQGSRISDIEFESFKNLNSLKYLDLSQNEISDLKLGALDGFKQLIYLNLSHNLLSDLQLGLFDQKPILDVLDLSSNKLEQLKLGIFDTLKKLRHLTVANNNLLGKDFDPNLFDRNTQINFIDFSRNDMNEAPEKLFNSFQVLEFLNLENCLLKEVPIFATRSNLVTLKYLFLSGNQIRKLESATTFINLENLEKLDLSDNSVDFVHEDVFKPLKKLKIITLRDNRITHLPETLFQNMKRLANIDLSHNSIETVPVNAFRGTSAKNLNLSSNRFTYLTDNFCLELRNSGAKLTKFYFNQNPWQCACLMQTLNEVKRFEIAYNSLQYDGKYPVCVTTGEVFCKRQDEFNTVYTDLYDNIVSS